MPQRKSHLQSVPDLDPGSQKDQRLAPPGPLAATDRLGLIYASPGPYTTVYLQTRALRRSDSGSPSGDDAGRDSARGQPHRADSEGNGTGTLDRWSSVRVHLERAGAPDAALRAIDARLALPAIEDTAAIGVVAAADGTTIVDHALEPPRFDYATVDTLPYAAPMLEWQQRRVPHLVVVVDEDGADIVTFAADHRTEMRSVEGATDQIVSTTVDEAASVDARLIVVGGTSGEAQHVADELVPRVAPRRNVVVEVDGDADELAEAAVRHVSDVVATDTVGYLREFRFLATHDSGVDGTAETLEALCRNEPGVLLIHDDPEDQRRVWMGPHPHELSVVPVEGWEQGRLIDAAIRVAVTSDTPIHVIPSTGAAGPDDGVALIRRSGPTAEPI